MGHVVIDTLSLLHQHVGNPDLIGAGVVYAPRARDRYGAMQRPTLIGMSCLGDIAPWWRDCYMQHEWYKIDPVYQACLQTTLPVWWGYDSKPNLIVGLGKTSSAAQVAMFHRCATEVGVRSGVSIPVHSALGGFGYIVFSSLLSVQELMNNHKRSEDVLLAASHRFMAQAIRETDTVEPLHQALSRREIECLALAAHGKTLDETATIMKLSERTVRFHLGNACDKLGTINRVHAIARASYLGLLGPVH